MRNTDWHLGNFDPGLHSAARASIQRGLAVCLADMDSQDWKIAIGQFSRLVTKSYVILGLRSPRYANKVFCEVLIATCEYLEIQI